jgi:hypothetical protein
MDPRQIRVYLKDTVLKSYAQNQLSDPEKIYHVLGVGSDVVSVEEYVKPHGRRLSDGRVISWSKATDWKLTLMAVFERSNVNVRYTSFAAVLLQSSSKFPNQTARATVEEAAKRLGLCRIVWLD